MTDGAGDFGTDAVIEPFVIAVEDIRRQLDQSGRWRGRGRELRVIAATDETDPVFLGEMRGHGWHVLDHTALRTVERFGPWGPTSAMACSEDELMWAVLDACLLSRGQGFAGTVGSTYSVFAGLRVEAWQGGIWLNVGKGW